MEAIKTFIQNFLQAEATAGDGKLISVEKYQAPEEETSLADYNNK